jgi:hypothetical protein
MQPRFAIGTSVWALVVCGIFLCTELTGQNAPAVSLQDQLAAQYRLAKTGGATGGRILLETGTVLEIKKGGLVAVAQFPKFLGVCESKFENGNLKGPGICGAIVGAQNVRYFTVGEKVYPVEVKVDAKKDKITVVVIDCDSSDGKTQPSSYMARVDFQFAKGYLGTASAGQIEDMIGQVFTISSLEPPQGQSDQKAGDQQQTTDEEKPEPQTIHLGQTTEQVVSALGKPDKIVDLGAKQIYVYKDIKVTFLNGKVSDVQ